MDVYGVADHTIGCASIHYVDVDVNEFGAVTREHGGAEEAIRFAIDHDLDEACRLADFDGFAVAPHVEPGGLDPTAGLARGALARADAAEARIGDDGVG